MKARESIAKHCFEENMKFIISMQIIFPTRSLKNLGPASDLARSRASGPLGPSGRAVPPNAASDGDGGCASASYPLPVAPTEVSID